MYSIVIQIANIQPVHLILLHFAYFFTLLFFKEIPMNGCFCNFNALLTKH